MIKVISTIIGTFIGAGFASGKEIHLFFLKYGILGFFGIIISSVFIAYLIYKTLKLCDFNSINNYSVFLDIIVKNKFIKIILKNIIDIFLIISFGVMISGFCSFLYQEFYIYKYISHIIILFFCYFIFQKNISGIAKINNILIPVIIFTIIYIFCSKSNFYEVQNIFKNKISFNILFLISSLIYANYNLLAIIPIVVNSKKLIFNKKNINIIPIFVGIIIFALSTVIFIIIAQSCVEKNIEILNLEMPVVYIVGNYGVIYKFAYSAIIGLSIITTAISSGYSYIQKFENNKKLYNKKIIKIMILSFVFVKIGFSKLLEILYPFFGFVGLIQSFLILKKSTNRE